MGNSLFHPAITAAGSVVIVAAICLTVACTGTERAETLDQIIGEDVAVAIEMLGQPHRVEDLGDGEQTYVWERIFTYDYGHPSFTLEEWRYDSTYGFPDDRPDARGRRCSTCLRVGFDMRIQAWDYSCETTTVDRGQWPTEQDQPREIGLPD